ncbi:MAG: AMP-binding protein, partial [bacterium]|nr:AMP-binding protein [bacterium]
MPPLGKRARSLGRLRLILSGGEALSWADVDQLLDRATVVNGYGPTEATVCALSHELRRLPAGDDAPIPLGRPLANYEILICDRGGRLLGAGQPGEICIAGPGLARGYLGRPARTAESFVPHPYAGGERLYRTGDLGLWLAEGQLPPIGSLDDQAKLCRPGVEPGEIEAVLAADPGVREVAVVVREESTGERRLAAWIVPTGAPPAADALRALAAERLPEYMVPAAFAVIESLPLLPSGKVDRGALSRRALPATTADVAGRAPRQPLEEVVAAIWCEVLGLERISVDQSFFEAGGHSLLATQVVSRIRRALGVELPLRELFEAPTIAALARRIGGVLAQGEEGMPAVPRPRPASQRDEPPLSFAQERLWFLDQLEPGVAAYNMPAAVRLSGQLDPEALAASLADLAERHETLRTRFAARHGEPVQCIEPPREVTLPLVDLRGLESDRRRTEARRVGTAEARRPFDLSRGPLLRVTLVRVDDAAHLAFLTMHHIVSDGWSMRILVRELGQLYGARVRGLPPQLPELAIQYADYAVWQRERLSGERLDRDLAFWREQLGESPEVLDLPADRPVPKVASPRGAVVRRRFPAAVAKALRARGREAGATFFMTLLAGFQALLHRESGQRDVAVGTPIAGRTQAEFEDLIGFFVNTLV